MSARSFLSIICLLFLFAAFPARVMNAGTPTAAVEPAPAAGRDGYWSRKFQPMGMTTTMGGVRVMCMIDWGGKLAVGGYFNEVGGEEANHVAVWNGMYWEALAGGLGWEAHALYDHGTLVVGGNFHTVDGEPIEYVAQWSGAEQRWLPMGDIVDEVNAFCDHFGGLYAGGYFYSDCALAHWDGIDWDYVNNVGVGSGDVYALESFDGSIYLGGRFQAHGALCLMGWDPDHSYRPYTMDGDVNCLLRDEYYLYIGGTFSNADDVESHGLVKLWAGGGFQDVEEPLADRQVWGLTMFQDSIYVATDYVVQRYDRVAWGPVLGGPFDEQLYCLGTCGPCGGLFAGGDITNGVVRWDDGEWVHLGGGLNRDGDIECLALYEGDVVVGGDHIRLPSVLEGQLDSWNVMRWDGDAWHRLGDGLNSTVYALAVYQDDLYAGGSFYGSGTQPVSKIARWDGDQWNDLGGASGTVMAFQEYQGGLVAGGHFTTIGGVPASRIARWDGAQWHALGTGLDNAATALTVHKGQLIAAGYFTMAGGAPVAHIARWDGAAWQPLGLGLDGTVHALTIWHGDLIAGGQFENAGGAPAAHIARWDGSAWHALGDGVGGESLVYGVTALLASTTDLFVGGDFSEAQGEEAKGIALWDGAAWSELGGGVRSDYGPAQVNGFLVKDGNLYIGGNFSGTGVTVPSSKMAVWLDGTITPNLLQSFLARLAGSVRDRTVEVTWNTSQPMEPGSFRLEARAKSQTWSVPFATIGGTAFLAQDVSPQLATADEVVYTLSHVAAGAGWQTVAEQTVTLGPPPHSRLLEVHPNPFNPRADITFDLERADHVRVEIYSLTGRRVATLTEERLPPGRYTRAWDGRDANGREAASGTYLFRLVTGDRIESVKAMLVR